MLCSPLCRSQEPEPFLLVYGLEDTLPFTEPDTATHLSPGVWGAGGWLQPGGPSAVWGEIHF